MFADLFDFKPRTLVTRLSRVAALTGFALTLAVPGHAQDADVARAASASCAWPGTARVSANPVSAATRESRVTSVRGLKSNESANMISSSLCND